MAETKQAATKDDQTKQPAKNQPQAKDAPEVITKPESSSEAEGAPSREPAENESVEVKTETSSSSGE